MGQLEGVSLEWEGSTQSDGGAQPRGQSSRGPGPDGAGSAEGGVSLEEWRVPAQGSV